MRFILNALTTILTNFRISEVPSRSETITLSTSPHIATRAPPRDLDQQNSTAAESAARIHQHRATANGAPDSKDEHYQADGTGSMHEEKPRGTKYWRAKVRCLAGGKPLRRYNIALVPQQVQPQPPGAFTAQQCFAVPRNPGLDEILGTKHYLIIPFYSVTRLSLICRRRMR